MLEILYRPTNQMGYFFPKTEYYFAIIMTLLLGVAIGFWFCDMRNKAIIRKENKNENK